MQASLVVLTACGAAIAMQAGALSTWIVLAGLAVLPPLVIRRWEHDLLQPLSPGAAITSRCHEFLRHVIA
jgi:hypothetical protein